MKKLHAVLRDNKIEGLTYAELLPEFVEAQAEDGITYEEIDDEDITQKFLSREVKVRDVVRTGPGSFGLNEARLRRKKNDKAREARRAEYPAQEEVTKALLNNDTAKIAQFKAQITAADAKHPLEEGPEE